MFDTLREAKAWVREKCEVVGVSCHKPYVYVGVRLELPEQNRTALAVGFAKCNPVDEWDQERGLRIARGRAEADLARKFVAPDPIVMLISDMGRAALADAGERMLARGGSK